MYFIKTIVILVSLLFLILLDQFIFALTVEENDINFEDDHLSFNDYSVITLTEIETSTLDEFLSTSKLQRNTEIMPSLLNSETIISSFEIEASSIETTFMDEASSSKIKTTSFETTDAEVKIIPSKLCADFGQIKSIFDIYLLTIYSPLLDLLPFHIQSYFLTDTHIGGLNKASLIIIFFSIFLFLSVLWTLSRKKEQRNVKLINFLNQEILALSVKINKLKFERENMELVVNDLEIHLDQVNNEMLDKDSKLAEINNWLFHYRHKNEQSNRDLEKIKQNEINLSNELKEAKIEYKILKENNSNQKINYEKQLNELFKENKNRINILNQRIEQADIEKNEAVNQKLELLREFQSLQDSERMLKEGLVSKEKILQLKESLI